MDPAIFERLPWSPPWQLISPGGRSAYEVELRTEVCPAHKLYRVRAEAVARINIGNEVLFALQGHVFPLAVVHLTFIGRMEPKPQWPTFRYFENVENWVSRCMLPDIRRFQNYRTRRAA